MALHDETKAANELEANELGEIDFETDDEPSGPDAAAAGQGETDTALQGRLTGFHAQLQRSMAELRDPANRDRPDAALRGLESIANAFVALAGDVPPASPAHALRAASETHPQARLLDVEDGRLSVAGVVDLYSRWPDDPADRTLLFRQIGRAIVRFLGHYVVLFGRTLRSDEQRERWQKISSDFLLDLLGAIDAIRF